MTQVKSLALHLNPPEKKEKIRRKIIKFNRFGENISLISDSLRSLVSELEKYSDITEGRRYLFRDEMRNIDNLTSLNMKYLAGSLAWIDENNSTYPYESLNMNDPITSMILSIVSINQPPTISELEQLFIYVKRIEIYRKGL